jgi:predicted anti-sigma-YlaC factor YlaD
MKLESKSAMHATQDELIAYIYHPEDGHIANCSECQRQISMMLAQRAQIEAAYPQEPSFDFLAAQRRKIYVRMDAPTRWFSRLRWPRWAPATLAILLICGGAAIYQETQTLSPNLHSLFGHNKISDAQLAADVSQIADNPIPQPAAPAEALVQAALQE